MEKSGKYMTVGRVINGIEEWSWLMYFDAKEEIIKVNKDPFGCFSYIPGRTFYYFRSVEVPKEIFYNLYKAMQGRFETYYNMENIL